MALHRLEREQLIPRPMEEVFEFFSKAENLEVLTPAFLQFKILTGLPILMEPGAVIEYSLKLYGVRIRWKTLIDVWEPGRRFVDLQVKGPYKFWRHTHSFQRVDGGTLMRDHLEYALPYGPLGALAHVVFVRRSVHRIFEYRRQQIQALMGSGNARS
ncbi:MAG: SRPBCC family protein [Acidobacteriota bacterium]|jgi:ligand-binding SRPBCC domain-containing protein